MQLLGRLVEALQGTVHEQERYIDQVYVCMIYVCMYPLPILRVCVYAEGTAYEQKQYIDQVYDLKF
jgi:hypothetical protein